MNGWKYLSGGLIVGLVVVMTQAPAFAMSSIRKAAIERLQGKLGGLRGTIERNDRFIFLTNSMIERLKPIGPIGSSANTADTMTTGGTTPNKPAGMPNTSNIDDITKAVDRMIENGN